MADNFKDGVSRVLEVANRQISNVIWQQEKPPLDSELNLMGQVSFESLSEAIRKNAHSGFLLDPTRSEEDFVFYDQSTNYFEIKRDTSSPLVALVNGWVVPVLGSESSDGVTNAINLPAPPTTDSETNVVFLEVWRAVLDADSADNKPDLSHTYPYGNVLYTASSDQDEMIDPTLGFETTKRVQVQYRLRVQGSNVDLVSHPEGLGDADIVAQGATSAPVLGYSFSNQKSNGDAGLWRAGDGSETAKSDLGTVDGYVYAIPVCAVFRRNSNLYQAISTGAPNHNGSLSRRPTASSEILSEITLGQALSVSDIGLVSYATKGSLSCALDDPDFFGVSYGGTGLRFLVIGQGQDAEVVSITSVDTINKTFTIAGRGRAGTQAKPHPDGDVVEVRLSRPDGLYADQVASSDVLDLRHAVTLGEWDYKRLLENAVRDLIVNDMRTTFKQAGSGSNSVGKKVEEVSVLVNLSGESRNYANVVDAPDGIRTIWSDAPVMQSDVTFLVDPTTATSASGITTNSMDATLQATWTIGAKFNPRGFLYDNEPIQNGSFFKINIGGSDNISGARAGLKPDLDINVVRFISPREAGGRSNPFKIKFTNHNRPNGFGESGTQGEFVAPTRESNFETPFIVLGESFFSAEGLVVDTTQSGAGNLRNLTTAQGDKLYAIKVATDLDSIYDTSVLYGTTTISDLVTDSGRDVSGLSSQAYLVLYGDKNSTITNNGVFKVVGVGSVSPYLSICQYALSGDTFEGETSPQNWLYLLRVGSTTDDFVTDTNNTLYAEMRTQYLDSRDNECMVAFTACSDADVASYPNLPLIANRTSPILISTTLQYPPARGATARVLDNVHTVALRNITTSYLRNAPSVLDVDAVAEVPLPNGEVYLPVSNHLESWSKLDPTDTQEVSNSQIKKESEAFIDVGSKTFVLRPYQDQGIRIAGHTLGQSAVGSVNYSNGLAKFDASLQMFSDAKTEVYAVPQEVMPSFGRQDIPYHIKTSANDPYMEGVNHLFLDKRNTTSNSFNIVGGRRNGTGVYPMVFATNVSGGVYGQWVANSSLANQGVLVAKKVSLTGKPTSEFGDVLNGIKLPPFFGIARLLAVYEKTDFNSNAPNAGIGAHETDRETPVANPPVNLLRKDNDLFPLYIQRGGGAEITIAGEEEAHTYIVTEHAINLRNIPTYVEGQTFSDFEYVVECTVFGFGLGFINENNFVLARKYTPASNPIGVTEGTALTNIRMCLPSAVSHTDEVYIAGSRTVYQGDPFQTIGGASPSYTDQPYRYGMVASGNAYLFNTPRGQEESDGTSAIDVTNKRSLQVLASMDFYTTMGTGAIGGVMRRNTLNDVGYPDYFSANALVPAGKRIPSSPTQALPQTKIGLFTGALDERSSTAVASLTLFSNRVSWYLNASGGTLASYLELSVVNVEEGVSISYAVDPNAPPADMSAMVLEIQNAFEGSRVSLITEERSTSTTLYFYAPVRGERGNKTQVTVKLINPDTGLERADVGVHTKLIAGERVGSLTQSPTPSVVNMTGGRTHEVNAFSEADIQTRQIDPSLVGLTSRLPLGILVSDHDFMCEDILRDGSTRLQTLGSKLTSLPSVAGADDQGRPYTKIVGGVGEVLHMGDGVPLSYGAFPLAGGSKKYRVFRGGGAVYGASGSVKGAPLTFLNESLPIELNPVVKGAVLACRAMLVRNFEETAFNTQNLSVRSYGDEVQLLIVTQAVFQGNNEALVASALKIGGEISPSGYGEGFACADRFRIKGLPLVKGNVVDVTDNEPAKLSLTSSPFLSLG